MIHSQHDIYENFVSATGTEDYEAVKDMFVDEISDVIIESPDRLFEQILDSGIPIEGTPTSKKLAKAISDNIATNRRLQNKLARMIAERHPGTAGKVNYDELLTKLVASIHHLSQQPEIRAELMAGQINEMVLAKTGKTPGTGSGGMLMFITALTLVGYFVYIKRKGK